MIPKSLKPRRTLSSAITAIGLLGASAAVVFVNLIAIERPIQLDITRAGDHRLAPRTQALLDSMDAGFEIVLAVNSQTVPDRGAFDRVVDLLSAIDRAEPNLDFSLIDLASNSSAADSASVVHRLALRETDAITGRVELITSGAERLTQTAAFFNSLADGLVRVGESIDPQSVSASTNKNFFEQRAGLLRVAATDLTEVVKTATRELEFPTGPATDSGQLVNTDRFLTPFANVARSLDDQLSVLARDLHAFANAPAIDAAARDQASPLPAMIDEQRDRLAILADDLARAGPIESLRVGQALETGETMLVIGPGSVVAVPISALLIETEVVEAVGLSTASWSANRAENLIASALGAMVNPSPPIVILTHGAVAEGVLADPATQGLQLRLSQLGIDIVEWAAAQKPNPPSLMDLDPQQTRPRVYVTLNPDSTAGSTGQPDQAGPQRAIRFAEAINNIIDAGEPVLLSANPSQFPTYGDTDPLNPILKEFGLSIDSGTPILDETRSTEGRRVGHTMSTAGEHENHSIAEAILGLNTLLPWPIPINIAPDAGSGVTPLLSLNSSNSWAEGEWLTYWRARNEQARATMPNKPKPGGLRDVSRESWLIAAAATRPHPQTGKSQRLVLVGSNGWYLDHFAQSQYALNQQSVLANPGNIELLEASIFWLAGQDELISRSTTATQIATVKPLDASQLATLKWTLLLGLPAAVLGLGIISRLFFG